MSKKMIGIGTSDNPESTSAGEEAARMALEITNTTIEPSWVLAFCGGKQNPHSFMEGIRRLVGDVPIVGGSAVGVITHTMLGYSGYECGIALFPSSLASPKIVTSDGLDKDEVLTGQRLAEQLNQNFQEGDTVLIFYDTIRSSPPPHLNTGSRLLEGFYNVFHGKEIKLIGAGLVGDFQLSQSILFNGSHALKHAAVAVLLPAEVSSRTTIMHGCTPVSSFMEITKIDGSVIYEIDGRRAYDVLMEVTKDSMNLAEDNISLILTLGKKYGDRFSPFNESAYVNRLIVTVNPDNGSIVLFEADFEKGSQIQIMTRDNKMMMDSVKKRSQELLASSKGESPMLALYIDCAGRSGAFSGCETEEADLLRATLGTEIPLFGFYSGVELAPLLGKTRPLDWTGVLTLLS